MSDFFHDFFHFPPITKPEITPGCIDEEFLSETISKNINVFDQVPLEIRDVLELGSILHHAGSIYRQTILSDDLVSNLFVDRIVVAPTADRIEILQGEPKRIEFLMTTRAIGPFPVVGKTLA